MGHGRSSGWGGIAQACALTVLYALPMFLTGALAFQIAAELRLDATGIGGLVAAFLGAAAVGSFPAGRLADRLGTMAAVRAAALGTAAACGAIATVAASWPVLAALLAGAGVSFTFGESAVNRYLAGSVSGERQGIAFGLKEAAGPGSALLAGLAVPALGVTVGWRWAFAGVSLLGLALLWQPLEEPLGAETRQGARPALPGRARTAWDAPLMLLALAFGVGFGAATMLRTFAVPTSVAAGMSPAWAGLLFSGCSAAALLARVVVGHRAAGTWPENLSTVVVMVAAGAVGLAGMASTWLPLYLLGSLLAFVCGWGWTGLFVLAVMRARRHADRAGAAPPAGRGSARSVSTCPASVRGILVRGDEDAARRRDVARPPEGMCRGMTENTVRIPQHNQLKDQAYAYVKSRILDLTFPPGQALREAALVAECGISKTPIREALIRLEQEGFVEVMPYRGAFVAGYSTDDLVEIYELRELLEGAAARQAAESMTPERLEEFRTVTDVGHEAFARGDQDEVIRLFDAFDDVLFAEVTNRRIARLLEDLRDHMVRIGRLTVAIPGRIDRSLAQHQAIFEAVEKHDPDAAERLMREHVRSVMSDQLSETAGAT